MPLPPVSWLLDTSLRASVVTLLLLGLRPALRRWIGSRALPWLWLAIAARLLFVFPVPVPVPWRAVPLLPALAPAVSSPFAFHVSLAPAGTPANSRVGAYPRPASNPPTSSGANTLSLLWLGGAVLAAARLARGWLTTRRWSARTLPPDSHPGLQSAYLALPAKLRRGVALRLTDDLDVPTLVGVLRPQIWLPRRLPDSLAPVEIRHVLLHELGHARRRDLLAQWLCSLACCLHWFNPLVWLLARVARTDRELACDAWVLSHRTTQAESIATYGHTLLKVVQGMSHGVSRALPAVSMAAGKRHLGLRVREIRAFRPVAPWRGVAALATMMALVATSTFRGEAAEPGTNAVDPTPPTAPSSPAPSPSVPAAIPPAPAAPAVPAVPDPSLWPAQVTIESKFIEMTKSGVLELEKSLPRSSPVASVVQQIFDWYMAQPSSAPPEGFRSSIILRDDFGLLVRQLNQIRGVDLLSAPRVTTKSGQKATVEIVREFIYPTAFERGQDAAGKPRVTPTSFDKTNTGVTLEVTPTVSSRRDVIDLSLGWKITNFDGFVGADGKPLSAKNEGAEPQFPVFDTHSVTTVASLSSGATVMFGRDGQHLYASEISQPATAREERKVSPEKDDERVLFIFVTATLIDTPPAVPAGTGDAGDHPPAPAAGAQEAAQPSPLPANSPAPSPADDSSPEPADTAAPLSYAVPVPGKPGFVTSPYAPEAGYVDVHGFTRGQFVRDPYTGNLFLVP